jgi:small-conductance mechanosensitive channel
LLIGAPVAGIGAFVTAKLNAAKAEADKAKADAAKARADAAEARADKERAQADKNAKTIDAYSSALNAIREELSAGEVEAAERVISERRDSLFDRTVQAQEQLADLKPSPTTVAASAQAKAPTSAPSAAMPQQRVYIQFAGSYTRAEITALNARLRQAGWNMQSASGERTEKAFTVNQVRYGPGGRDAAIQLAAAINADPLQAGRTVEPKAFDIVGPRNLEVWLSN